MLRQCSPHIQSELVTDHLHFKRTNVANAALFVALPSRRGHFRG